MTIRRGDSIIAGNSADIPSQTGQSGKFLTTNGTTTSWAAVNVDTSDIYNKLDTKQDKSTAVNYDNISNCITEIPQDIKLELNNGILTLKAGSKVYVPNGFESDGTTKKFDVKNIKSDVRTSPSENGTFLYAVHPDGTFARYSNSFSGDTQPTNQNFCAWYDTTNNKIKRYLNNPSIWEEGFSFPIAIVTISNNRAVSIDPVFNGFGYIGNTIYALPGVKGRIPNGRNADGSLKSIEVTVDNVKIINLSAVNSYEPQILLFDSTLNIQGPTSNRSISYNETKNYTTYNNTYSNTNNSWLPIITFVYNDNKITSFTPKTVFHALDYNDKSTISGWSMPSSRYIDLTLAASGSRYTAPANGYVYCERNSTSGSKFVSISIVDGELGVYGLATAGVNNTRIFLPVKKGEKFKVLYSKEVDYFKFRFFYTEGGK